ncbi:unnamed protein product [Discosporangium mesarthrocarpum]
MGGGQQEVAVSLLRAAAQVGDWVCLKNLHLVVSWLPSLEKELSSLETHQDFRLWLTTEPHNEFPPLLLQQSLKVTFEAPPGLKKNLQRTYSTWPASVVEEGDEMKAQLLLALAWFHGIVQERKVFKPQGWTKEYEFSVGDLRAGSMVMAETCKSGRVDWKTVRGLMEDAVYGGRVDNPFDMRVLTAYLQAMFNSDVVGSVVGGADRGGQLSRFLTVPGTNRYSDYIHAVQQLPDMDHPSVFGLPDNIERSVQRAGSSSVIAGLRRLSAGTVGKGKFDRETWRAQLGPLLEAWDKLSSSMGASSGREPGGTSTGKRKSSRTGGRDLQPVDAFVVMEDALATELVTLVGASLAGVKRVVYGTALLTPAIQATGASLMASEVPPDWSRHWEGPETPQAWLSALARRKVSLSRWVGASVKGTLLDEPVDLSDLFNPSTFLNAVRQQTTRQSNCSMDALKLVSCWESGRLKSAMLPVSVEGLRLQGAAFSGGTLHQQSPNDPEVAGVPDLTLAYVPKVQPNPYQAGQAIDIPLYFSLDRERLLVEVSMPTKEPRDTWILAGVALFLKE